MSKEIDIAALRKAAQEAAGWTDGLGAWTHEEDKGIGCFGVVRDGGEDALEFGQVDTGLYFDEGAALPVAQYYAAVGSSVILALLDRLEQAEKDAKELAIDAALGRTAMKFVDRAGDGHPEIDEAVAICAEFYEAMTKTLGAAMQGEGA